jgi:transposase
MLWYGTGHPVSGLGALLAGLVACMSVEGAADAPVVVPFTEHVLVPALRPGQVVITDNLSFRRAPRVRVLIERAGCRLRFRPPYSLAFTPFGPAWSRLKALFRGVGTRTTETLHDALTPLRCDHHERRPWVLLPPRLRRTVRWELP